MDTSAIDNIIPQDAEPTSSNKEISTTGAIGILGVVSMDIPQILALTGSAPDPFAG